MSLDFYIFDVGKATGVEIELYWKNVTHNLSPMWKRAGVYKDLYESEGKQPKDIIESLKRGLKDMKDNPKTYKRRNPWNGWGDYEGAIKFLSETIEACEKYPEAFIHISR